MTAPVRSGNRIRRRASAAGSKMVVAGMAGVVAAGAFIGVTHDGRNATATTADELTPTSTTVTTAPLRRYEENDDDDRGRLTPPTTAPTTTVPNTATPAPPATAPPVRLRSRGS